MTKLDDLHEYYAKMDAFDEVINDLGRFPSDTYVGETRVQESLSTMREIAEEIDVIRGKLACPHCDKLHLWEDGLPGGNRTGHCDHCNIARTFDATVSEAVSRVFLEQHAPCLDKPCPQKESK